MKNIFKISGSLILLVIVTGCVIFFFFPQTLIDYTNNSFVKAAKLEKKSLDLNGYQINYFESAFESNKETLVLVHGMGDDKNSFLQSSEILSEDYHLILPDLAGHGENEKKLDMDYSIDGQATFLFSFLEKLGIKEINLVGNSMGGHTAAAYAIKYPNDVNKLVLLNAAGLKLDDHITYTGFGQEITNDEELDALLGKLYYKIPDLPGPIRKHMMKLVNNMKDFVDNTLIPAVQNGKYGNLNDDISKISSPTLILWGKEDKVIKLNTAKYFNDSIPSSELQFIENVGHSPQLEMPVPTARAIHAYLKR